MRGALKQLLLRPGRLLRTLAYLQPRQIYYRLYYPLKRLLFRPSAARTVHLSAAADFPPVPLRCRLQDQACYDPVKQQFRFLNKTLELRKGIDWDFRGYGLLWTYHLHYFDWLNDGALSVSDRLATVRDYVAQGFRSPVARHPYPASLRVANWIRFFSASGISDPELWQSLYRQGQYVTAFPEYHLLGNHLLENRITGVWLAMYFERELLFRRLDLFLGELGGQILDDGAHYERSMMYHQQLLGRLLDLYEVVLMPCFAVDAHRVNCLKDNILSMLSWCTAMQLAPGIFPQFGDSCEESMKDWPRLQTVAQDLITEKHRPAGLAASGFRRIAQGKVALIFNCGCVTPAFQPGHAHADLFSFCLSADAVPVIVDAGISTYEQGARRAWERGTAAHNTVTVNGADSSEVWAGFRMGRRAEPVLLEQHTAFCRVEHNGYERWGIRHERSLSLAEDVLTIRDHLRGWNGQKAMACLHFHPDIRVDALQDREWELKGMGIKISCTGGTGYTETYAYGYGFNQTQQATRICINMDGADLETTVTFNYDEID